MKPSIFRPSPRKSPQAPTPAPAPKPSPSFPKMGNPLRSISRRPAGRFKEGGMPMVMKDGKKIPEFAADGQGKMAKGGMAKMKTGGASSASKRADGVAIKGKTKGKLLAKGGMTKMRNGGKC